MARPRSAGDRYPCGDLKPKRPASVVEAEQRAAIERDDDQLGGDLLALRMVLSATAFQEWVAAGCDVDALPANTRDYLERDRKVRAETRRLQKQHLRLLEMRRQMAGSHIAA